MMEVETLVNILLAALMAVAWTAWIKLLFDDSKKGPKKRW